MPELMLRLNNISKKYQNQVVLNIPDLVIKDGECVGLVGNNGAGKTTCFSLILDLIKPTTGEITIQGHAVNRTDEWKKNTGSFLDESFLISFLTPNEYFQFIGSLYAWQAEDLKHFLESFEDFLQDDILLNKKYIRDFSKGNQKRIGLIGSMIGHPQLLIWDEPFSNLDPSSQIRLKKLITQKSVKQTLFISSHDLNHIAEVCHRIIILEKGIIIQDLQSSAETLKTLENYFAV